MSVTICSNGLTIVHQGSGGEANASEPDVCKTTVGPAVKNIAYENNAKSADLAEGTVTVCADGGNSIAMKGSKFAVSVGDADGDQKGVDSGTIEDEAEFTGASPNVIMEGKGVARLSDPMTMNKANTICSGVQNPSLTVDPVLEVPSSIDICVRYPNGKPFKNAAFVVADESGAPKGAGTLDASGKSNVNGLKPGKIKLKASESADPFEICPIRRKNPHFEQEAPHDDFFARATKGQQGFWQPVRVETGLAPWGSIGKELSSDRFFQDIVELETKLHFEYQHPDSAFTLGKTCDVVVGNLNMPLPHTTECMLAYCMPLMLEEGEILSVLLRLASHETTDRMTAFMRARGEGNPLTYLQNYDWSGTQKQINESLANLLKKIESRIVFLRDEASKLKYSYLSEDIFDKHIDTLKAYTKGLPELISMSFTKMQLRATTLLANSANVNVTKDDDNVYSTEAGDINKVVNTTQTIDTVEPFMNLVAGKIDNVIPIYPVRYGYANFFDEILPAQAPPTLPEMAAASGLNETGGYLLRLLREGWVYIKEEEGKSDNQQIHIFRYVQTETPNGVIEQFEKYYFTNEENAQDGLTLDISSGSTFYPFAFVTANTQKISIAYSEHEWAADIIDKMNSDQEWRTKAMQQVDMSASDDFSDTATQDKLNSLVEDYRSNDVKWLADKEAQKPTDIGKDIVTTQKSYHLVADELVETMQKSHSEKKDGTLVVLFDPVGRQRDIANQLKMTLAEGQAYQTNNLYPLTIGSYAKACLDSEVPEVSQVAQENLDTQALTEFWDNSELKMDKIKEQTQQWLDIMAYFVSGEGAKNELGSLTFYMQYYIDTRQEGLKKPVEELVKLFFLIGGLFDGVTASEDGMDAMDDWVGQAFTTETLTPEDNAAGAGFKIAERIFTQCHGGDWSEWIELMGNHVLGSMGTFLARLPVAFDYVGKQNKKWAKIAGNVGLEKFYRTTFPSILDALLGLKVTGNRLPVPFDDVESLIKKQAISGRAASIWQKTKTKWYDKLIDWSETKVDEKQTRILQLLEFEVTPNCPKIIQTMIDKIEKVVKPASKTAVHIAASTASAGFSGWSFFLNVEAMYEMGAQDEFTTLDPITNKDELYRILQVSATLGALAADSIELAKYGAKSANATASTLNRGLNSQLMQKYLPTLSARMAEKLGLANVIAYSQHMDNFFIKAPVNALVAIVTIAEASSYGWDAYKASQSGNVGLKHGNLLGAGFSIALFGTILFSGFASLIFLSICVAGLFWSDSIIARYTKTGIENLLFRCFWGKSEDYSFWKNFVSVEKIKIAGDRLKVIESMLFKEKQNYFETAFQIESQEFINYLYWPQLEVESKAITPGVIKSDKLFTFRFVLPEFKMGISQLHGTLTKELYDRSGIASIERESTEPLTEAFKHALVVALNDPQQHEFKQNGLHLTLQVECPFRQSRGIACDLSLKWCYEPEPSLVVPKRILTSSGDIDGHMIGMINDKPNDNY
ncbi:toxin VasX [Vibrio caribbeanicus]|uniref:Toxin VasX N-terminal region domain-containing protein n=1 Tax=Vibrio caribbeanicus ATCC BAA-2122 TaxID=796620 RepID=E3BF85_9VIBR|nr:toxin VasX [Vibrio caribbeanicus]EFP98261.1 hypothetical protein VIBC2010_09272 [Vibrio caribbeanicus ATCC BAA-2122]